MSYDFDTAIAELSAAAKSLESHARETAIEELMNDEDNLKAFAVKNFGVDIAGIGYECKLPDLTVYLYDRETAARYVLSDPIADLFNVCEEDGLDAADQRKLMESSIAALQSGIDRIRARLNG